MRSRLYSLWLAVVAVIAACALGILGLPAVAFAQSPAVTFTPSSGPVGTSFTITGSNWMPGGQVPSTLPYGSPGWFTGYQAPTVDANGKFSYTETVGTGPGGPTPSGTYTYTYVENSLSATQTFTVTGQSSGAAPHITGYTTYTQGVMVILSVTYTGTADGFGFKGINGSGWAEENHPLSSPSYGHVSPGKIEYPFNHACGTSNADQSDVAFWVYTGAARNETTAHLACSGQSTDNGQPPAVVTPYADAAANWAWARRKATTTTENPNPGATSWSGWCEAFVEAAYRAAGHSIPVYGSANAHKDAKNSILQTGLPPRGAIVFYVHDHVVISMGDGTVVGTWNYPAASTTPNHVDKYSDALDGAYVGCLLYTSD